MGSNQIYHRNQCSSYFQNPWFAQAIRIHQTQRRRPFWLLDYLKVASKVGYSQVEVDTEKR